LAVENRNRRKRILRQVRELHRYAAVDIFELVNKMKRNMILALYIVVLIAVVVGVDLLFFRNQTSGRLLANIGIILVFVAFYWRFLKNL
jgi:drug/metabolite transporter superfamily protein YnfA